MNCWLSDSLTRIRNGIKARKKTVVVRGTSKVMATLEVLKNQGFIKDFRKVDSANLCQGCEVDLAYFDGASVIKSISMVSKPSLKSYVSASDLISLRRCFAVGVVSTNKGVMSDMDARRLNLGGELLCEVR